MAKELSLLLRVKNEMQVGLSKAKKSLSDFGSSVASIGSGIASFGRGLLNVGKWAVAGFGAATTAVVGFATKAVMAYAQQQKAEREFEGALRAHGEEIDNNLQKIRDYAAQIQNETAVADENLIARAARLRMLGVETDAMDQALRATVALASAGMGEEQAIRAVAMAHQGNFEALQRYIPALRNAQSESEKAAIVNDFLTKGYEQQASMLNTISGRWREFRGRISDLWEEFGRAIEQNGAVSRGLAFMSTKVVEFGQRVREYVDSAHFQAVANSIEGIVRALAGSRAERNEVLVALGELLKGSLVRGAELAGDFLMKVAPKIGSLIGAGVQAMMPNPRANARATNQAVEELGFTDENGRRLIHDIGAGYSQLNEEMREAVRIRTHEIRQQEILNRLGIQAVENAGELSIAQTRIQAALEKLNDIGTRTMETLNTPIDTEGSVQGLEQVRNAAERMREEAQEAFEAQREAIRELEEVAEEALEVFNRPMDTEETEAAVRRIGEAAKEAAQQAVEAFGEGSAEAENFGQIADQAMEILSGPLDTSAAQDGIKAIGEAAKEMARDARLATWDTLAAATSAADGMTRAARAAASTSTDSMREISIAAQKSADDSKAASAEKAEAEEKASESMTRSTERVSSANTQSADTVKGAWRSAMQEFEENEQRKVAAAEASSQKIADANVRAASASAAAFSGGASNGFQLGQWSGGGSFVGAPGSASASNRGFIMHSADRSPLGGQSMTSGVNAHIARSLNQMNDTLNDIRRNEERLLSVG